MDEKHKSFCGGFFEKQRSFRCTERIGDLITQLDSKNLLHLQLDSKNLLHLQLDSKNLLHPQPNTPSPTAALFLLNGKWILASDVCWSSCTLISLTSFLEGWGLTS
ncbi:hypothetical protein AALP_AAs59244U000100 [Arabis alpina]|uniref:Plastid lipid-associated protein/fibrillin conserved domain-containing protein n=1 Tax=Arabis alpina TaxID=50452 RepID=A0A087FXB7_ARAAL|nr:hypothetical protein AALP_AAs59244U000100 [Arabis alpina]